MLIRINGKEEHLVREISILDLLMLKKLNPEKLIVGLNDQIMSKKDWASVLLKEKDQVEILSLVSGG